MGNRHMQKAGEGEKREGKATMNSLRECALMCSDYNKKEPYGSWLINCRHVFPTVLKAEKVRGLVDLVSGRACFLIHRQCLLPVCLHHGQGKGLSATF
jgi:hypothetical protein